MPFDYRPSAVLAVDIAKYILEQCGTMTTMKLQKLVYYCQAWALVWDDEPLFPETIKAWAYGPVVPALYMLHKGKFKISAADLRGDSDKLTATDKDTCDAVLETYGDKTSRWLSQLTHLEKPWIDARQNVDFNDRSPVISHASMGEYYSSL